MWDQNGTAFLSDVLIREQKETRIVGARARAQIMISHVAYRD